VIYVFGYLDDDFYGRVIVTSEQQTVAGLATQLEAWGPTPATGQPVIVRDESGTELDPARTVADSCLGNGAIFRVSPGA
jgi:hypothetical protein